MPVLACRAQFSEDMLWSCIKPDFTENSGEVRCRNGDEFIEG